jgi:hypothetical protein
MLQRLVEWVMQGTFVEWATMLGEWGIVAAIVYEGHFAFQEFRGARLLEILRHMEHEQVRKARDIVFTRIARPENQGKDWWEVDEFRSAASEVASAHDRIGVIINFFGMGDAENRFLTHWGETIVRSHEVLNDFLNWRRRTAPNAYTEFTALYQRAKLLYPNVPPPQIPAGSKLGLGVGDNHF